LPKKSRRKRKQPIQDKGKAIPVSTLDGTQEASQPRRQPSTPEKGITTSTAPSYPIERPMPHLQIGAELKRIGILAGIIIGALVVLAFTLP